MSNLFFEKSMNEMCGLRKNAKGMVEISLLHAIIRVSLKEKHYKKFSLTKNQKCCTVHQVLVSAKENISHRISTWKTLSKNFII